MTNAEFFGCSLLAFGPPFAMFIFTIAHDPVRIIILIAAAFFWLLSLLLSSLWWFMVAPLRQYLVFGLIFSVIFQEVMRYMIYRMLRKATNGLRKITNDATPLVENKHILAYVSGLGFGIMCALFSSINVVADAVGPGTMGLKSGNEIFFLTSSAMSLCFMFLHTFWSVIFFDALDQRNHIRVAIVVLSHMFVSCISLLNRYEMYYVTILISYLVVSLTGMLTFKVAGGSLMSLKSSFKV